MYKTTDIKIKGHYADHILIPKGSTGSSFLLYQMKAHIFLIANPKFQLQILCSLGVITKSVKLNGIPENNLCIFIIASSPGVHTFFYLWRVNKKLTTLGWNFKLQQVCHNWLTTETHFVQFYFKITSFLSWDKYTCNNVALGWVSS